VGGDPLIYMGGSSGIHGSDSRVPIGYLTFLRRFELEADRIAVQTMARAGYDPATFLSYVEVMQSDDRSPAFSPLPARDTRLAALRRAIAELQPRDYRPDSDEFLRVRKEITLSPP
jgi:predicted Zn-dependent protease